MLETAENLRRKYSIPRQEQDEYSLRSHQRAVAAWDAGKFDDEIVPVTVTPRQGELTSSIATSTRARDTSLERLAALRPDAPAPGPGSRRSRPATPAARTTPRPAASSRRPEKAHELGLKPMAQVCGWAVAGVHPAYMGIGPVPATEKALERAGLSLADMDADRAERGVRGAGAGGDAGLGLQGARLRPHERQRLGHLASATRSARPAAGSWRRCCTRWSAATRSSASRPCASAAARASRPSSSGCRRRERRAGVFARISRISTD